MTIQRVEYPPGTGGGGSSAPVGYTHGDQWFLKEAIQVGFGGALGSPIKFKESIATAPLSIRDGTVTKLLDGYKLNPGSAAFNDGVKTKFTDSTAITATTKQPDTLHLPDTFRGTLANWQVSRSGTPDSDTFGDAWVDVTAANEGVNHGADAFINVVASTAGAVDNIGFMKFDLTKFSANNPIFTPVGNMVLSLNVSQDPIVAVPTTGATITAVFSTTVGSPFTESTLTYNNKPGDGASSVSKTVVVATGEVGARKTFTLAPSEYSAFFSSLGQWVMVRLNSDQQLATGLVAFSSREAATVGNRPLLSLGFKRS